MNDTYMGAPVRKVHTYLDRVGWASGPWDTEPDYVQWVDDVTGLPCLMHRGGSGSWCGYVAVAEGHPWFAKGYDDVEPHPDVHGGLTYAAFCAENRPEGEGICHVPAPGEPDRVWWVGFDTAHAYDLSPLASNYMPLSFRLDDVYRDSAYVMAECASLARQAANAA